MRKYCRVDWEVKELLRSAIQQSGLSARLPADPADPEAVADDRGLAGNAEIGVPHMAEANQYRTLDRRLWE